MTLCARLSVPHYPQLKAWVLSCSTELVLVSPAVLVMHRSNGAASFPREVHVCALSPAHDGGGASPDCGFIRESGRLLFFSDQSLHSTTWSLEGGAFELSTHQNAATPHSPSPLPLPASPMISRCSSFRTRHIVDNPPPPNL